MKLRQCQSGGELGQITIAVYVSSAQGKGITLGLASWQKQRSLAIPHSSSEETHEPLVIASRQGPFPLRDFRLTSCLIITMMT